MTRSIEQQRQDDIIRSVNCLVKRLDSVYAECLPEEIKTVFAELKRHYPNGISIKHGEEFGYLFVGRKEGVNNG